MWIPVSCHRPIVRACAAALCCLTLSACDEKLSSITGPTPNLQPTFDSFLTEIVQSPTDQACINCHVPGGVSGGILDLRPGVAYANLVNARSREKPGATLVIPGDPDNSYLIQKLEGRSDIVQLRMPRNGPPFLTPGQILVIRTWIARGANNN